MFKISIVDTRTQRKLVVEGKLTHPWVDELRSSWRDASRDLDGRRVVIDVSSLTVISSEGEEAIFDAVDAKIEAVGDGSRGDGVGAGLLLAVRIRGDRGNELAGQVRERF